MHFRLLVCLFICLFGRLVGLRFVILDIFLFLLTGSGKTSLLRAILNMSTSFDGTILVGGKSLEEIPKQLLRSSFGMIP